MSAYIRELARVLQPGAFAFLHHSNLGEHKGTLAGVNTGGRGSNVTAELVRDSCCEVGLVPIALEKVRWIFPDGPYIDCFSLVARPRTGSDDHVRECADKSVFHNPDFWDEIKHAKRIHDRYTEAVRMM
jgi:hypothetical protein